MHIIQAILELNCFLIKYRLKTDLDFFTEDKFDNKLFELQRVETFKLINANFNNFDEFFKKLRNMNTPEYLKNFLQVLKIKNGNFENIETPYLILCQRSNYLKGKFALCCGHYSKALEFFYRSRGKQVVCDAGIIRASIKQIYKIIKKFENEIDKLLQQNNDLLKSTTYKFDSVKNTKKIQSDMEKLHQQKDLFSNYLTALVGEFDFYTYNPKDVIVLIDISETMLEDKKVDRASKIAMWIFDNFITNEDKFGLFVFGQFVNNVIGLTHRNDNNLEYLRDMILSVEKHVSQLREDLSDEEDQNLNISMPLEKVFCD